MIIIIIEIFYPKLHYTLTIRYVATLKGIFRTKGYGYIFKCFSNGIFWYGGINALDL